jgi:hypothetical protein
MIALINNKPPNVQIILYPGITLKPGKIISKYFFSQRPQVTDESLGGQIPVQFTPFMTKYPAKAMAPQLTKAIPSRKGPAFLCIDYQGQWATMLWPILLTIKP